MNGSLMAQDKYNIIIWIVVIFLKVSKMGGGSRILRMGWALGSPMFTTTTVSTETKVVVVSMFLLGDMFGLA